MNFEDAVKMMQAHQNQFIHEKLRKIELERHTPTSCSNLLEKYNEALDWLKLIEIPISDASRVIFYRKTILKCDLRIKSGESVLNIYKDKDIKAAVHDAYKFITCFECLKDQNAIDSTVIESFTKAVKGPKCYTEEKDNNGTARNFLFELEVSTYFYNPKSVFIFNENPQGDVNPSIEFLIEDKEEKAKIMIECKRVHSPLSVVKNMEFAATQANKRICDATEEKFKYSMIFIDLTKLLNPSNDISFCHTADEYIVAANSFEIKLEQLALKYETEIQNLFIKHPLLIGVFFQSQNMMMQLNFEIPTGVISKFFLYRPSLDLCQQITVDKFLGAGHQVIF